jgi:hypothetical protein
MRFVCNTLIGAAAATCIGGGPVYGVERPHITSDLALAEDLVASMKKAAISVIDLDMSMFLHILYDYDGITQFIESTELQVAANSSSRSLPNAVKRYEGNEHGNYMIQNERHSNHALHQRYVTKVYFDERAAFAGFQLFDSNSYRIVEVGDRYD